MKFRASPAALGGLCLLGGLNAWLLVVVAADPGSSQEVVAAGTARAPNWSMTIDPIPTAKPIDAYKVTLAHPVFFKTRAPYVPPPPPPPPKPAAVAPVIVDPGLVLGGVMIQHGLRQAFLFSKTDPRGEWRKVGETFMGWTVQSVEASGAKLRLQDRTLELQLYPRN